MSVQTSLPFIWQIDDGCVVSVNNIDAWLANGTAIWNLSRWGAVTTHGIHKSQWAILILRETHIQWQANWWNCNQITLWPFIPFCDLWPLCTLGPGREMSGREMSVTVLLIFPSDPTGFYLVCLNSKCIIQRIRLPKKKKKNSISNCLWSFPPQKQIFSRLFMLLFSIQWMWRATGAVKLQKWQKNTIKLFQVFRSHMIAVSEQQAKIYWKSTHGFEITWSWVADDSI